MAFFEELGKKAQAVAGVAAEKAKDLAGVASEKACWRMATSSTIWHTAPVRMPSSAPWNILHLLM